MNPIEDFLQRPEQREGVTGFHRYITVISHFLSEWSRYRPDFFRYMEKLIEYGEAYMGNEKYQIDPNFPRLQELISKLKKLRDSVERRSQVS